MIKIKFFLFIVLTLFLTACAATKEDMANRKDVVILKFEPKKCQETPWDKWYSNGNVNFIEKPNELDLMQIFYGQTYGIRIISYEKINRTEVQCDACDICNENFYVESKVINNDVPALLSLGWTN